jgi:hypothetical protein
MKQLNKVRDMKGVKVGRNSAGRANRNALRRERRQRKGEAAMGLRIEAGFRWTEFCKACDDFMREWGIPIYSMREMVDLEADHRLGAEGI